MRRSAKGYKAKHAHDCHCVYQSSDDVSGRERLRTVQELRTALDEDQLVLHFQPKIDLLNGAIDSVEALVRWAHPTRGLLYPGSFLELVEDSGLMHTLRLTVLNQALDQSGRVAGARRELTRYGCDQIQGFYVSRPCPLPSSTTGWPSGHCSLR